MALAGEKMVRVVNGTKKKTPHEGESPQENRGGGRQTKFQKSFATCKGKSRENVILQRKKEKSRAKRKKPAQKHCKPKKKPREGEKAKEKKKKKRKREPK